MQEVDNLLIEIGTEELPAKALAKIANNFGDIFLAELSKLSIRYSDYKIFATPRRIAIYIKAVARKTSPSENVIKGPAYNIAFLDNQPTPALLSFAKKCQTSLEMLTIESTEKGRVVIYNKKIPSQASEPLLKDILQYTLDNLPFPRKMRWGANDFEFVRPIRSILVKFGTSTLEGNMYGVTLNNICSGHRFFGKEFAISHADNYEKLLKENYVIPCMQERQATINQQILALASSYNLQAIINDGLLQEVTGLTEYPYAIICSFNPEFLTLPKEVLITSMQTHQRAFPLLTSTGTLDNKFIITTNNMLPNYDTIRIGNEQVMHARLSDALFYFQEDQKITSSNRAKTLSNVIFYANAGSILDKCARLANIMVTISTALQLNIPNDNIHIAAQLCKNDLRTLMVGEFPELQGIMGGYYAQLENYPTDITLALSEHYKPTFAEDSLPANELGALLSVADKLDTITQLFAINKKPTGDKDPFSLRRQALGAMRIIIERQWDVALYDICNKTVIDFCLERLKFWYEEQGIAGTIFDSAIAVSTGNPYAMHQKILAIHNLHNSAQLTAIIQINKRLKNILGDYQLSDPALLIEPVIESNSITKDDQILYELLSTLVIPTNSTLYLDTLLQLQQPLDDYFKNVMVRVDDEKLRNIRLGLLKRIFNLFNAFADFTKL